MPKLYSLEESITEFFETYSTVTKESCHSIARSLVGDPIAPVSIQGAWSYTVAAGETKIVQFRAQDSILDMERLHLARQIHPEFVPEIEYHGATEGAKPLSIYTIDKVPGIPHVIANSHQKAGDLRLNTVRDFSRFFAQAWKSPQPLSRVEIGDLTSRLQQKLDVLLAALPIRFSTILTLLRQKYLPLLMNEDFPIVLTHADLYAELAPFGLPLYGIINILGVMDSKGWHYHTNYQDMVAQFWTTLEYEVVTLSTMKKNLIRAACTIGIFLENGFMWNGEDKRTPVTEGSDSMIYLDSWLGAESHANDLLLSVKA